MSQQIVIKAAIRTEKGKGPARKLRSNKSIPAVLYGHKVNPIMLSLENSEIAKVLKTGTDSITSSSLIKVQIENNKKSEEKLVMIREVQQHPFKHHILHMDLFEVNVKEKIHAPVQIRLKGEAPGIKEGGILRQILREVEINALPTDIPEYFEVDVSALEIGDSIHVSSLTVPDNVKILTDEQSAIVNVLAPTIITEETDEEAEDEEGMAEGVEAKDAETAADSET